MSMDQLLSFDQIRVIDHSEWSNQVQPVDSFAIDDALCISVGEHLSPPAARLWVHDPAVILGIPDSRLPYLDEAVSFLEKNGFQVIIRNSGGLAVLLDQGVLNLSLIFPDARQLGIHDGYEAMVTFIRRVFAEEGKAIEVYEVKGSYCPGAYDLSMKGKKFAGISQRKVKNGTAVQIYLAVEGSGQKRSEWIRQFYQIALKDASPSFHYPEIHPETMASLEELLQKKMSVKEVRNRIVDELRALSNHLFYNLLSNKEHSWYIERLKQMKKRNERLLEREGF
ncbi:octanoyl-[GcvH]:protein N-octanoyltransferase [Melghiribacillus thermohalophilus]|uniref:Octanoyl-[GcvH]:protein N-octanoyltransferase n=2 Tax=Melghiribacillus thermohalophilus TaxID=1324956 RepID=A0A4R3NC72_9BACI|nr:octanoyl-[GcvH]:protein N-octanoyltransferase [Melghiribacillus thermohalophilus]